MADIQTLVDQVMTNAEKEEQEALAAFENDINDELKSASARIDQELTHQKQQIENNEARKLQTQKQSYLNTLRNERLTAKQDLLDKVYNEAIIKLQQLSSEEFTGLIKGALNQLSGTDQAVLKIGEYSQHQFDADQVKAVNGPIDIDENFIAKRSGFIVSREDLDYNFTFESIIDQKKAELAAELVKRAF